MKKILVMLTKSSYGNDENLIRLGRCKKDDVVIFAQDAVYSFSNSSLKISGLIEYKQRIGVRIFASLVDCQARGINPPSNIKMVGYPEQVDLIFECELTF